MIATFETNTMVPTPHSPLCGCPVCAPRVLCRPRYFPRQLVTPDEMNLEADYFRDALRRMRRMMWGWGVVCGAQVRYMERDEDDPREGHESRAQERREEEHETERQERRERQPWKVRIEQGYAIGPCGDEIVISCEQVLDLRNPGGPRSCSDPSAVGESDPWCVEPPLREREKTVYIAVRYAQVLSRPVRVQPCGCGCGESPCEYSRWCDGFEFDVLDACPTERPAGHKKESGKKRDHDEDDWDWLFHGHHPHCPEEPKEPWVGLAKVRIGERGHILDIDNCACRRMVASFAHHPWWCDEEKVHPSEPPAPRGGGGGT